MNPKIQAEIEKAAKEYETQFHKDYPGSMTVSVYCNEWVPDVCFQEGAHFGFALATKMHEGVVEALNKIGATPYAPTTQGLFESREVARDALAKLKENLGDE